MAGLVTIHADPLGLLVAFGAGMLSFLSPCVLPLVPAYLSMVSGLSAAELGALQRSPGAGSPGAGDQGPVVPGPEVAVGGAATVTAGTATATTTAIATATPADTVAGPGLDPEVVRHERRLLLRGILAFIAGFTVIFTILGATSSAIGHLFLTHQHTLEMVSGILIVAFGAMLVAMASGVTLPTALLGERRFVVRPSLLGPWGPAVMGMAFAFAWTPCIGPVLGSVLALAAGTGGSATGGIALLVAYSLGLGVPFLLSGLALGRMTDVLARVRGRLWLVDLVGGAVLIVFGFLLLTGRVDIISHYISDWLQDLHLSRLSVS
jgi:cytochrome c-type biogenesis protein